MWGAVTNTGKNSMPTSLGIVRTLIHCLRWGSVADKPRTAWYPSVSVADITDCATSLPTAPPVPLQNLYLFMTLKQFIRKKLFQLCNLKKILLSNFAKQTDQLKQFDFTCLVTFVHQFLETQVLLPVVIFFIQNLVYFWSSICVT